MIKKILLVIAIAMMTACAGNKSSMTTGPTKKSDKLNVVVTTSFLEDMVNVLVGDKVDTQLIIPAGEDPHTYEAKPEDKTKLQNADLVLYHGLHFEGRWLNYSRRLVRYLYRRTLTNQKLVEWKKMEKRLSIHTFGLILTYINKQRKKLLKHLRINCQI